LANAAVIGLATDMPDMALWETLEAGFLLLFTAELVIRLIIFLPSGFFNLQNHDIVWNVLDFVIVLAGIVDATVSHVLSIGSPTGGFTTLFRVIRLLRIFRIVRLVRFMKQLYLLAFGFVEAAQAVIWVSILMTFVLYVCAVLLVKTIGQHTDAETIDGMLSNFSSIPRTMLTLFEVMASPTISQFEGVMYDYPLVAVFLIAFVIFGSFGMIALLTGVVSESMFQKNQMRQEEERKEHSERRKQMQKQSEALFAEVMNPETGEAKVQDVKELIVDIQEMFNNLGIEYEYANLENFSELIDVYGSGTISQQEFQHGILSMAHGAQSVSTMELYYNLCVLKAKLEKSEPLWVRSSEGAQQVVRSADALSHGIDQVAMSLKSIGDVQQDLLRQNQEMLQTKATILTTLEQFSERMASILDIQIRAEKQASKVENCLSITSELKDMVEGFHQDFQVFHEDNALFHNEIASSLGHNTCNRCSLPIGNAEVVPQSIVDACSGKVTSADDDLDKLANSGCPSTHELSVKLDMNHGTSKDIAGWNTERSAVERPTGTQSSMGDLAKCQKQSSHCRTAQGGPRKSAFCDELKEHMRAEINRLTEMLHVQTRPVASLTECKNASDSFKIGSMHCSAAAVDTHHLIGELIGSQQATANNMTALSTQVGHVVSGQQHIQSDMQQLLVKLKDASWFARAAHTFE